MDKSLLTYADITFDESGGNTIKMTVSIPAQNPRKRVPPLIFNVNDALTVATNKYGARVVEVNGSDVLENRPRTNVLNGTYLIELVPSRKKTTRPRRTKTK